MSSKYSVPSKVKTNPYKYAVSVSIQTLEKVLRILSKAYYHTKKPLVSDEIFDLLKGVLLERDPKNPFIKEVGAPISKDKVSLPYQMASLDKIKPDTDRLNKWMKKYPGSYYMSDKLDGVSAMYYKDKKGYHHLYTRGNAKTGQNITHLLAYFSKGVKFDKIPKETAVRGELVIAKKTFEKKLSKKFKNARNTIAGLVNSKNYSVTVAESTDFVAYAVVNPRLKISKQFSSLKKWGFNVVEYSSSKKLTNKQLSELLLKRRDKGDYDIDGIVVMDDSKEYENSEDNPDHAFAFKMVLSDQVADVIVREVVWDISKDGYLKPVVHVEPVKLVGVTVKKATGFNAKFIKDNKIGPGAVIRIVRSGDVIPYIKKVVKSVKKGSLPNVDYKWNKTKVDIIDQNHHKSSKVLAKRLQHFFTKLEIKNVGLGIATKFVDAGYETIQDILKTDNEELSEIDGIGETLVDKIKSNIESVFSKMTLPKLMAASQIFGRGLGSRKIKLITDKYLNIMKEKWNTDKLYDKVIDIDGFDHISAKQFSDNFDDFKKFFKSLDKVIDISHVLKVKTKKVSKKHKKLDGLKIVFTGFRDSALKDLIENAGGKVSSSVSSKTNLVIYVPGGKGGFKLEKAKGLKIKLMTKDEFEKAYK